jgi:hypothetical protein
MKTLKVIISIVVIASTTLIQGCTKKGDVGPAGKDGSSNVSATVFQASSWSWSAPNYYINLNVPEITSDNLTSAAIMVYFTKDNTKWIAVPFTQYNSPYNYLMGFNTSIGQVQVTWIYDSSLSSGDNPNIYYGVTTQYKVVVIPKGAKAAHPDVNLNNYSEVKKAFNIMN